MARWIIGSNMPGYMPDSDPFVAESFAHAALAFIGDLDIARDDIDALGGDDAGDDMSAIDGAVNKIQDLLAKQEEREIHVYVQNRHYWLEKYIFD